MPRSAPVLLVLLIALIVAAPAGAQRYVAGSSGLGDPFYPYAGNGGYDVRHYKLNLSYDPAPVNRLEGEAKVRARATQNLYRFNLDFRPFYAISSLTVNGRRASYRRELEHELVITPRRRLRRGEAFKVVVRYAGTPEAVIDPDDSQEGWIPTDDGAFVVNEPQGSPGWYPANDNPRDKATYDVKVSVPEGRTVIGNGELLKLRTRGGRTTWRWREDTPMAPYLATATNGNFDTRFYSSGGRRFYDAVDPNTRTSTETAPNPALAWERLATQAEVVAFFSDLYGDYPFTTAGGIVDYAPSVGYALESQTRANYHRTPSATTVVHEIAHQWFGNAVTLAVWPDIWLNEGFARWSQWIYDERHAGPTAQSRFDTLYARAADNPFWTLPPGNVGGAENLFASTVYDRGAMTLQALRQKVGDDTFFAILRAWYEENRYGTVTTADFVELSERLSGQQLDAFFDVWLYQPGKPASW